MTTAPTALADAPRARRSLLPSPSFLRFLGRRLVALVFLAIGITFVVFVLTQLVPTNAVTANLGEQAAGDPAAVASFKRHYGLDRPLPVRYVLYLKHVAEGDLGQSALTHDAVTHDLSQFIPATAALYAYWPIPGQVKIFSTSTAPVSTFAKTSPSTVTTDGSAARRM